MVGFGASGAAASLPGQGTTARRPPPPTTGHCREGSYPATVSQRAAGSTLWL